MAKAQQNDFFKQVWQVVELVPSGRVTSYGAIAKYLGAAKSARMVGWAMNASHASEVQIPAHRVLNRNGVLTGKNFFENPFHMQELLEQEGVEINKDQVVQWKELFWDPAAELTLE